MKDAVVHIRVPESVKDAWMAEADRRGLSLTQLVTLAVNTFVEADKRGDDALMAELGRAVVRLVRERT